MLQAAFQMSLSLSWSKAFGFNTFQNGRGRKSWASGSRALRLEARACYPFLSHKGRCSLSPWKVEQED